MQTKYHLKDLATLSNYQSLKIAKTHLLKQGMKSTNGNVNGSCKYRADNKKACKTLMCGIGIFINDSEYNPKMEGERAEALLRKFSSDAFKNIKPTTLHLLHRIQIVHDFYDVDKWEEQFKNIRTELPTFGQYV
jgi:hypothetical protein